jgi:hypothetical protein
VTEEWEAKAAEYDAGLAGSRRLMERGVGLITAPADALRDLAAVQPHDAGVVPFLRFPNGHPSCFVCGTCKRARVLDHQAAGRAVGFIGDGHSDR